MRGCLGQSGSGLPRPRARAVCLVIRARATIPNPQKTAIVRFSGSCPAWFNLLPRPNNCSVSLPRTCCPEVKANNCSGFGFQQATQPVGLHAIVRPVPRSTSCTREARACCCRVLGTIVRLRSRRPPVVTRHAQPGYIPNNCSLLAARPQLHQF